MNCNFNYYNILFVSLFICCYGVTCVYLTL